MDFQGLFTIVPYVTVFKLLLRESCSPPHIVLSTSAWKKSLLCFLAQEYTDLWGIHTLKNLKVLEIQSEASCKINEGSLSPNH